MKISDELYQQLILEHNKKPKNFRKIDDPSHMAEGFNPLCGDHYHVYANLNDEGIIEELTFEGTGCAISKASASMMTQALIGKTKDQAEIVFEQFHQLVLGKLDPEKNGADLGRLAAFAGIWKFPTRVKCAVLCWHTLKGALNKNQQSVSTE